MVAGMRFDRTVPVFACLVASVFFTFLYIDVRSYNRLDEEVSRLVSTIPPGQRVIAAIFDSESRVNGAEHIIDGVCTGRCFSYGNYEPATGAFRIHAFRPNGAVAWTVRTLDEIQQGKHVVTPEEAPIYAICAAEGPGRRLEVRKLEAGQTTCLSTMPVTPALF
jgi:hypothetical protein